MKLAERHAHAGSAVLQGAVMRNASALVFGAIEGYVFAAIVGLPTLVVLRRHHWRSIGRYVAAGTFAGAASGLVLGVVLGFENYKWGAVVGGLVLFAAHGFVVSLAYWLVAYAGSSGTPNDTGTSSANEA